MIIERSGREIELKIENIRLLHSDELIDWKTKNLDHHQRDVSALIAQAAVPEIIQDIISHMEGIVCVEIIDIYDGYSKSRVSVTYRVTIQGDMDAGKVHRDVNDLLVGIGCTIR